MFTQSSLSLCSVAAGFALCFASSANAATVSFDTSASEVTLVTSGGGTLCGITSCDVEATLSDDFLALGTVDIEIGESITVDVIDYTFSGISGFVPVDLDLEATLSFDTGSETIMNGEGETIFASGAGGFSLGLFDLDIEDSASLITIGDLTFSIVLDDTPTAFVSDDSTLTTSATITLLAAVPLPATGGLLLGGFALVPLLRRKRRANAS